MAALELDPLFLKALTLLRSKSRESADQLRALLDEVLGKKSKTGPAANPSRSDDDKSERKKESKEGRIKKSVSLEDPRRNPIKRPLDKQVSLPKPDANKKMKLEIPKKSSMIRKPVIDDDDEPEGSDDDAVFKTEKTSADVINISSDSDDLTPRGGAKTGPTPGEDVVGETDMDDFALELGLACVVCKKMDVSAKNQLIECQECHSLYHQFCHKPAATDADANDPRLVWYCAKCQRNMRKSVDKKPLKTSSSMSDLSSSSREKGSGEASMNLFKRSEPKTPPVSSAGKSQPFTGLANFAANVSGKSSSSTKSSSAPSKPSTIIGKSNIRVNMATSGPFKPGPVKPGLIKPTPLKSGGANTVPSRPGPSRPTKPGSVGPGVSRSGSLGISGPAKTTSSLSSNRTIVSKFKSSASGGSRSPSPQPSSVGASKAKGGAAKNLPQVSQASAMKRLQQMKKKASKR